ncbi:hypothetical protein [Halopiger xanaduensis]|uniref:Uncharacterized protein n=1 Tax=Halopiger xanaduensis (strain DSM 18323 / JCM 14033 / SH-6) TaxID=797210 RepID=F8DDF4_HALXS|nr:hypothetical protein [Halopiger xanaduensis]AEH39048.1 hypothetical protein Halxa_0447 [Halopiger xanaduensis SH-6]
MAADTSDDAQASRLDRTGSTETSILGPLQNSYALQTAAVGLIVTVIAFIVNTGIWAAILGIWGIALVLVGVAIHVAVTVSQRGTRG